MKKDKLKKTDKLNKKDYINILILTLSFCLYVFLLVNIKYYYGSTLDWFDQHVVFPDYFRNLFYKTHTVFPDFAFNIGNGQNIYNFSYYGLLSPYVLVSYLLPFINMVPYMIGVTILSVIASGILMYIWLRKKGNTELISFFGAFLLMFATSMSFHSHRHFMFMNYMPFLIMGLYGVDRKLDHNRNCLLAISVFLMVMTSYYYSIGGIIALVIYGVYKYLKDHKEVTFKKFIIDGIYFIMPIVLGILLSAIITLPTFQAILSGRGETHNTITLKDIFLPKIYLENFVYAEYGIGLGLISILAIVGLFDKKKENIFLGIVLSLFLVFPFFNYILNATMYIDAKALIPLLPICIIAIVELVNKIIKKELNYKIVIPVFLVVYVIGLFSSNHLVVSLIDIAVMALAILLFIKTKKELLLIIPICLFAFGTAYISSHRDDNYIVKKNVIKQENIAKEIVKTITDEDSGYYRINLELGSVNNNRTFNNFKYYNTTLYSSVYNMNYNKFYHDVINNNFPHRNRVITSAPTNIMSNILTSSKYLVTSEKSLFGYEKVAEKNGYYIYKNENVLPIAYSSANIMSYDEFDEIGYPNQTEALVNYIIVDKDIASNYESHIENIDIDFSAITTTDLEIKKEDGHYIIKNQNKGRITYRLPKEARNKILFIRFKDNYSQSCDVGDSYILVNKIKNKLTCKEWKYHNGNYDFDYVIYEKDLEELTISFSGTDFDISDIKMYALDYSYIANVKDNVSELKISKMIDNILEGTIEVKESGYFTASIPYDNGFTAFIDGKEVKVEKVNAGFIGFPIEKGKHDIKIVYKAPLKNIALIISSIGLIVLILVYILEKKQKI